MEFFNKFGVPWLDRSFGEALQDDSLVELFGAVSDSLGPLLRGSYDTDVKQMILINLLGPAFICKHFRADANVNIYLRYLEQVPEHEFVDKTAGKFSATTKNIQEDLSRLSFLAMTKAVTKNKEDAVEEKIKNIFTNALMSALSIDLHSNHDIFSNTDRSIKSFLLEDEENQDKGDLIGSSICALLDYDIAENFNLNLIARTQDLLKTNFLNIPKSLRQIMWLLELDVTSVGVGVDNINKENFTSIGKKVVELFCFWPGLKTYDDVDGNFQMMISKILTQFENFRSFQLFWLVPLMIVFLGENEIHPDILDDSESLYSLSIKLSVMLNNKKLKRKDIFDIVHAVFEKIKLEDFEYYQHLNRISSDPHHVNRRDFDEEVICYDLKNCARVMKNICNNDEKLEEGAKDIIVANGPQIFVRRWLQSGFVNILNKPCLMFVWDFLFLHSWTPEAQKAVTLSILMLIRFWMMRGHNYRRMRNNLMFEPSRIYLSDLRLMIKHMMEDGSLNNCPQNTNYRLKVVEQIPFWEEVRTSIRRDSLIKKVEPKQFSFSDVIGKISSKFQRKDSVSSVESEEGEQEEWLKLWIPYNSIHQKQFEVIKQASNTIDFYIDAVRFLPQNISVAVLRASLFDSSTKSQSTLENNILPELVSFARLPNYRYKVTFNLEKKKITKNSTVSIQIYGYDKYSCKIVSIGSTIFKFFEDDSLNYGGHQLPVYRSPSGADAELLKSDKIPCLTLLVRLLPPSPEYKPAVWYDEGFYQNKSCHPSDTEWKFYKSYFHHEDFLNDLVKKNILLITKKSNLSKEETNKFLLSQFTQSKKIEKDQLDILRFVRITTENGIKLSLEKLFGLSNKWENKYFQIFGEIVNIKSPKKPLARMLSQNFKMKSFIRSPVWEDDLYPVLLPELSDLENIVLIVKIYSFKPEYAVSWEKEPDGKLTGNLDIDTSSPDLWSLVPLFTGDWVKSGLHYVPMFKGGPGADTLTDLQQYGCSVETLKNLVKDEVIKPSSKKECVVLVVKVVDGHFDNDSWWKYSSREQSFCHQDYLEVVGGKDKCSLEPFYDGRTWRDFVLDALPQKLRKKGAKGAKYIQEEPLFVNLVKRKFLKSMNESLRDNCETVLVKDELLQIRHK